MAVRQGQAIPNFTKRLQGIVFSESIQKNNQKNLHKNTIMKITNTCVHIQTTVTVN